MKKILYPIIAIILVACTPQVTVTPEVTVTSPPPTATPIPTPTLHPQFVKLQSQIAASGEHFTLLSDGTIEETTAEGAKIVPGLSVDKNGVITLQGESLKVTINPEDVSFDDEKGVNVKGYTLDEATGLWGVGISEAESAAIVLFDKYNVDPATYTLTDVDGIMVGTDKETGTEIFRDGRFEISYAVELAKKNCEPTNIIPKKDSVFAQQQDEGALRKYIHTLRDDPNYNRSDGSFFAYVLVDREKQCWAFADGDNLVYRNETGIVQPIPTNHLTEDEVFTFILNR